MNPNHVARRRRTLSSAALALIALALLAVFGGTSRAQAAAPAIRPVCGAVPLGHSRCLSWVKGNASPLAQTPSGYGPADLQSAYNLPSADAPAAGQTVAIVDALRRPERRGRPRASTARSTACPPCTTANGCFRKVNQNGGTLAAAAAGRRLGPARSRSTSTWSRGLPELPHPAGRGDHERSNSDLVHGGRHGGRAWAPTSITNSYGGGESSSGPTSDDVHFDHPGVAITASLRRRRLRRRVPGGLART